MPLTLLATFFENSPAVSMCSAGVLVLLIALWTAKSNIARGRGFDKIVALSNLCFSVPLAIFAAEHFAFAKFIMLSVPTYMPGRLFLAYFIGVALLCAALSIATKIQVSWSGLLFGIMMVLFVAMLHVPRAMVSPNARIPWTIVIREMSFAGGGWILAGAAMRAQAGSKLVIVGRVLVAIAAIFFGVEHFLHPANCPGVPLEKLMPVWIPGRLVIGYLTGAILLVAGICMLLAKKTHEAATYLGSWIVLLVLLIYVPILVAQLSDPNVAVKTEGINYFADTLLFGGAILALASATSWTD